MVSFNIQRIFVLMNLNPSIFSSMVFRFCVTIRKAFFIPSYFSPYIFRFDFNPTGIYFCEWCLYERASSYFFLMDGLFSQHIFLKVYSFPADLLMLNSYINMSLILDSLFCSIALFAVLMLLLLYLPFTHGNLASTHNVPGIIPKCVIDLHVAKPHGYFFRSYLPEHYLSFSPIHDSKNKSHDHNNIFCSSLSYSVPGTV